MDELELARRLDSDAAGVEKGDPVAKGSSQDYQEKLQVAASLQNINFSNNSRHYESLRKRLLASATVKLPARTKKSRILQMGATFGLVAVLTLLVMGLALGIERLIPTNAVSNGAGGMASPQPTDTATMAASSPTQTPGVNSTATANIAPTQTENVFGNKTVVKFFMTYQLQEYSALSILVDQFNAAYPDIQVILSNEWPKDNFAMSMASNYDCFIFQNDPMNLGASGQFLDMSTFLQSEAPSFIQDFDPALLEAYRYQGALVDLPLTTQPTVMSYNANLLARRGLTAPSNDWTYADFLRLIQAAASTSPSDLSYGFAGGQDLNIYEMLLSGRKVPPAIDFSAGLPVAQFNSPEMPDALAWLAGLAKTGALYRDATTSPQDWWLNMSGAFQAGQIAFWDSRAGETNGAGVYLSGTPLYTTGAVLLPVMPEGSWSYVRQSYDRGFYISRQSKNPQACWTLIKYLSEQPASFHGVPARISMAALPAWEASVGTEMAALYRTAAARVTREPVTTQSYNNAYIQAPLDTWFGQAMDVAFNGGDIELALTEAQQKADVFLSCIKTVDTSKVSPTEIQGKLTPCAKQADPQETWWP